MSEEFFSARPADGGVLVTMSAEFSTSWLRALKLLARAYVPGVVVFGLHWPRWAMSRPALLRKMFPDAAESRWRSTLFRRRRRRDLADIDLVERVSARWASPSPFVLTRAEVDDWIVVMGQLRALYLLLRKATPAEIGTISHVQHALVVAVDPTACNCSEIHPN